MRSSDYKEEKVEVSTEVTKTCSKQAWRDLTTFLKFNPLPEMNPRPPNRNALLPIIPTHSLQSVHQSSSLHQWIIIIEKLFVAISVPSSLELFWIYEVSCRL